MTAFLPAGVRWLVVHGDCREVLPRVDQADVVITDPPYSEHVHSKSRAGTQHLATAAGHDCSRERTFGFDHLTHDLRRAVARESARLCKRWALYFCDLESVHLWRRSLAAVRLEPLRVGIWIKEGCTPQFTGDRPAVGCEAIVIAHTKGRKQWNGGGSRAVWSYSIVGRGAHNSGHDGKNARLHTAQKPIELMMRLVELFTEPGELVLDPFCGSGTTGVACLRLGRRFIGIEQNAEWAEVACARLAAEEAQSTLAAQRSGQQPLFGGAR